MPGRYALLAALLLIPAASGGAQQIPDLKPGDRIRLESPAHSGVYVVEQWTDSSRLVRALRMRTEQTVDVDSIRRLEVRRVTESRLTSAVRRGAIGMTVCAILGGAAGYASGDDEGGMFNFGKEGKAIFMGMFFGTIGLTVGAISGAGSPRAVWEQIIPPPGVSLVRPPGGGVGIAFSRSF